MQQMADWLEKLGMSEYAKPFAENRIDFSVLPDLTDQDLEKLGVLLGDRRKMLRAIAKLDNTPAAPPRAVASAPSLTVSPLPEGAGAGERRYLTVMFCDLVDSTGIAARLDAEEWRDLVGGYLDAATAAVTEMGGHVSKKLGDGLLALFGYPVAQENDSERAARAALSIQHALAELNRKNAGAGKPALAARIGLETGPAVVDAAGEIYGDVANIAARVQALAEPGAVLVTARVQRQIAGLFVAEERGTHTLKGVLEPTVLFRLVRASGGGRRSAQRNLTPLVGRDDEMAMLLRRWERARQGEGQLVLIVGEPGLGKSRLIEEFHARLREVPHTWVEWSCSQLLQNTPLHPIAEWGRARFGGADIPAERRLAELESSLAQVKLDPAENASLLAPLLDIPLPSDRAPSMAPEELRRRQLAALTAWVMAGARTQSVVLALEDLHWADPTTLDVLRGIAERGALAPLLVVATTRPEFRPPWGMRSHHSTISLAPLDRLQVGEMVAELSALHALPKEVVEDVAARTGGVPLFVEEVTRLLLERGEQGGVQTIPPTLQQSLTARLDRLGSAREVAQIGSVVGRGFSYNLLHALAGMADAPLQAALEKLAEADILLVQGLPPESDYRFKHALIQDAAYENLLKSRRQVLHRRVAEILRDRFAATAAAEPEALAHHFTQAGLTDEAIEWWGKAGDQALRRSAFQEAIAHLGKAIEMADKADNSPTPRAAPEAAADNQRLKLQTSYGQAVMLSRGFAAEETKAAFSRARELAADIGNADERFDTYYGLFVSSLLRGELSTAWQTAEAFRREADNEARMMEASVAHRNLGMACLYQGDFVAAQANFMQALTLYDPVRDREAKFRFGTDCGAGATAYLALTKWHLGEMERARELIEELVTRAVASAHAPTLALIHSQKGMFEMHRGDAEGTLRPSEALAQLSHEHRMGLYMAWGSLYPTWARARLGQGGIGSTEVREALAAYAGQGNRLYVPFYQGLLAEIEGEEQNADGALARIDEALALAGATGEHWTDAFLHRIRGEILLKRDPANTAPAEEAFLAAIAIAQQQKARSFELRAALSLAKLYQSTGRAGDAHAVLAPALASFSPTPEFPEIAEAQMLLAALAETDEMKKEAARHQRRFRLQTSYSNALLHGRGMAPVETTAAFAKARELAAAVADPAERFSAYYGLWVGPYIRAEMAPMREVAEAFLRDAERWPGSPEVGIAHRLSGTTCWYEGDYLGARRHLEQALAVYDHERDRHLSSSFAYDPGVAAKFYLGMVLWTLGEIDRGVGLVEESLSLALQGAHIPTVALARFFIDVFAAIRRDPVRVVPNAQALLDLEVKHGLPNWLGFAKFHLAWAGWRCNSQCVEEMRAGLAYEREVDFRHMQPLYGTVLAEVEAAAGRPDSGLAFLDEQIATIEHTGERWFEAEVHRARGEILLKRDTANTAPAEQAFLTAIAVAQQQKARSFELRAALSLAKLYQSTGRPADAHAVLAAALEGFSPTPEMPEIEEAQALLVALSNTDEVKNAAESRQRRLKLQTSYGRAMMWSRGFGAEEAKAAFTRAKELATGVDNAAERFNAYYGLWVGSLLRGELGRARETAETFRRETADGSWMTEAAVACRILGYTCLYQGNFAEAQAHLEEARRIYDPERDRDAKFRFGQDTGVGATVYLGTTKWMLGEIGRARELIEEAVVRAGESDHVPTRSTTYAYKTLFETFRSDAEAARRAAETLLELSRQHGIALYLTLGALHSAWAHARLGDRETGTAELRQALARYTDQGNKLLLPFYQGLLAELEAEGQETEAALARIDAALPLAGETGERWTDAFLHRIRGEVLLKRDPANTAPAEDAFLTAIAVARAQKARSFELRAAISMARLWRDQGKRDAARDLLAPVYDWFTEGIDTLDLKESKALLDELNA